MVQEFNVEKLNQLNVANFPNVGEIGGGVEQFRS